MSSMLGHTLVWILMSICKALAALQKRHIDWLVISFQRQDNDFSQVRPLSSDWCFALASIMYIYLLLAWPVHLNQFKVLLQVSPDQGKLSLLQQYVGLHGFDFCISPYCCLQIHHTLSVISHVVLCLLVIVVILNVDCWDHSSSEGL